MCCDKRMVKQALSYHDTIYTRQRWNEELGVLPHPNLVKEGTERMDDPFIGVVDLMLYCWVRNCIQYLTL